MAIKCTCWYIAKLNILLNCIIEGQALTYANITDGLVVKTMAGYPMKFIKKPNFTINENVVIFGDTHYTNGVSHHLATVPDPLIPWMKKTNYDILLEVNEQRNGDLSTFIALVNMSDLKNILMLDDDSKPITVFVPTNEALSTIVVNVDDLIRNTSSYSYQLLWNHFVEGNFVINMWWRTPTGTNFTKTEHQLTTKVGNILDIEVIGDNSTHVNSVVSVIQQDVFSFYGILQIIDLPLIPN